MHFDRFEQFPIEDLIMQDRWRREEAAEPFFTEDQPCEYCGHPASECGCDEESITCGKGKILHFVAGEPHL